MQVPPPAPFQVIVVAESKSRKVETCSFFLQAHYLRKSNKRITRFLPIDLQSEPSFKFRFNPVCQASPLIARQHRTIGGLAH